jgi:hypothetical protein
MENLEVKQLREWVKDDVKQYGTDGRFNRIMAFLGGMSDQLREAGSMILQDNSYWAKWVVMLKSKQIGTAVDDETLWDSQ